MRTPRILAVDDEPDFRDLAVRHLNRAGYQCIAAADAAQGLNCAAQSSPDLIILDVAMRGMNGFDLLKNLRRDQHTASIPVIVVSGDAANAHLLSSACENMSVSAFVRKPVDWADMRRVIQRSLDGLTVPRNPDLIVCGLLRIDVKLRRVFVDGADVKLGYKRFDVLLALARSQDGLTTPLLAGMVWGAASARAIHAAVQTVQRLRLDLRRACGREMIFNIPGGYKLL